MLQELPLFAGIQTKIFGGTWMDVCRGQGSREETIYNSGDPTQRFHIIGYAEDEGDNAIITSLKLEFQHQFEWSQIENIRLSCRVLVTGPVTIRASIDSLSFGSSDPLANFPIPGDMLRPADTNYVDTPLDLTDNNYKWVDIFIPKPLGVNASSMYSVRLRSVSIENPYRTEFPVDEMATFEINRMVMIIDESIPYPPVYLRASLTEAGAAKVARWMLKEGGNTELQGTCLKVAFFSTECTRSTPGTELVDGGYARITLPALTPVLMSDGSWAISNPETIIGPQASLDWLPIRGFGIYDDLGTYLFYGVFSQSVFIRAFMKPVIQNNCLQVRFSWAGTSVIARDVLRLLFTYDCVPSDIFPDIADNPRRFRVELHDPNGLIPGLLTTLTTKFASDPSDMVMRNTEEVDFDLVGSVAADHFVTAIKVFRAGDEVAPAVVFDSMNSVNYLRQWYHLFLRRGDMRIEFS